MSEPRIIRFDSIPSVNRGSGVTTKPLAGSWIGAQGLSSGITTFPPHGAIRLHTHNVEEMVTILEGEARCEVEGNSYQLKALDTTYVPAGLAHRFVNTADRPMRILWVYAGTHVLRTFVETGETVEHLSPGDLAGGRS